MRYPEKQVNRSEYGILRGVREGFYVTTRVNFGSGRKRQGKGDKGYLISGSGRFLGVEWDVFRFWGISAGIVLANKPLKRGGFFNKSGGWGGCFWGIGIRYS
jgi:hypothetical protein